MAATMRCLTCGVEFAAFGGPDRAVANFNAHRCARPAPAPTVSRRHPSDPTWRPDGAA